jgi:O-antigen ligase
MPSFLGYHDFAALAGTVLAIAIAVIASGTWSRLRALALAAALAGVIGVVIGGALATVIALILGCGLALLCMVVWKTVSARRVLALAGLLIVVAAGSLALRGNDLQNYIGFLGDTQTQDQNIETYSQRTVLAYIGLKIFLDHPLTGVGWQASELPTNFEPHLGAAHRRFPDVAAGAFPSDAQRWGVQNAYVQAAADMGIVGLGVLLAAVASAFLRSATRALRGTRPPGPLALALAIAILVGATEWAALGLVPGVPTTALLWLAIGGAVALPRDGALPDDLPRGA